MNKELDIEKIKFLPVSSKDLVLALDRLTRFKFPEIKYYRVFSELLCKYLISPKLSKNEIKLLEVDVLKNLIQKIWNESVKIHSPNIESDKKLNLVIQNELLNTYNLNENMQSLIRVDLNINGVLSLVKKTSQVPINLKRLILIEKDYSNPKNKREKFNLRFPVEKVLLCEGATEEILMPKFAALTGYNFDAHGVRLISAGGKNQVAKLYCELKDELKIPIFILLDADAQETSEQIENIKRQCDVVYLIKHGEFEDIFSLNLIKRTINKRFKNICECSISDFKHTEPMTKILADFFRLNNLGDFQKADFAKELGANLKYKTDLTEEIIQIVEKIKLLK